MKTKLKVVVIISLLSILSACAGLVGVSKTDQMLSDLRDQSEKDPDNVDLHGRLAQLCFGKYEQTKNSSFLHVAANELKEVIRLKPDDHWGHCTLSLVYHQIGKYDLAIFEGQEAERLDPHCLSNRRVLGSLYYRKAYSDDTCIDERMVDLAIEEYKESIRLKPDDDYFHSMLANLYRYKGSLDLAMFEAREAVRLSGSAANHRCLGCMLDAQGDHGAALGEYQEAIRIDPRLASARRDLAWAYLALGRYDDAIEEQERYIVSFEDAPAKINPLLPIFFGMAGTAVSRSRSPNLSSVGWNDVMLRYILLTHKGEREKGRNMLEAYARTFKGPDNALSLLQYYVGKARGPEIEEKVKNRCDRTLAYFFIGYDHLLNGDTAKAIEYFHKTLDAKTFNYYAYPVAHVILKRLEKE